MAPRPDSYERGKLDERMEVAITTIRKVEEKLDRLTLILERRPCATHTMQIRLQWALLVGVVTGFTGLFWYTVQHIVRP
jgi:hypothetical protein